MDASTMAKLKELVTSRRLKEAELLLSGYLLQTPDDYTLLMHMGGVQTSMFNYKKAEEYYKKAIKAGKRHSGSAKVQLMRIYTQQSRDVDLILLLKQCLETESKSITLKEQIIQVYLKIFEPKSALIYSRQLIEQIKEMYKKTSSKSVDPQAILTEEHKKSSERNKVLADVMKQSDLYFIHSQILNKVGRFSDCVIYCKKSITTLQAWLSSLSTPQRNMILNPSRTQIGPQSKAMQYYERMNRFYGYLGLCYLHVDDIENALNSFKKALNINPKDRIAKNNIHNITNNRTLFNKCKELKGVYQRYIGNKLTESDNKLDIKAQILAYIQLLVQQNRLLLAQNVCEQCVEHKTNAILGYDCASFAIVFEDILRQKMNQMVNNLSENVSDSMDKQRNASGSQRVLKEMQQHNVHTLKSLPHKIWDLRCKIDCIYQEALKLSPNDCNLCIAYLLCLWRIGYNAKGIDAITSALSKTNAQILKESKYYLLRGNAFLNEDENKLAQVELEHALKLCTNNKKDEIQTLLLMAVCYNKMNQLTDAQQQCERILKMDKNNTATLKIYASILQRRKKYKQSKEIFMNLLNESNNIDIATEYIALLIEMKEYDEAKKRLQIVLSRNPQNALELMYEFGVICFKMGDTETAQKTFISIISQSPKRFDGAFVHLVNILKEEIALVQQKLNELDEHQAVNNTDDKKTEPHEKKREKLEEELEDLMKECKKYLFLWIQMDFCNKTPYLMYLEHLWALHQHKEAHRVWKEWIQEIQKQFNEEFEGKASEKKESEQMLKDNKEKAAFLLSDLYQKYARMLTQNKVVSRAQAHHDLEAPKDHELEEENEDESCNEEIESYFSKALQFNEQNVDALQGFAAYYVSNREYIHALPFLRKAQALHKSLSVSWIQLAQLYETIASMKDMNSEEMKQMNICTSLDVLKEGVAYIKTHKYRNYKQYVTNMVQICAAFIEQLILCGSDAADMECAEKYCWFILKELDPLNVTSLREISKVSDDKEAIDAFFTDLLAQFPTYCPALVEYAQFLTTAKKNRTEKLAKAQSLLEKVITITGNKSDGLDLDARYRCVAFYILGFVKLHQMTKIMNERNKTLNDEARDMFKAAVKSDEDNIYARINLAQFLAFKDNNNTEALHHLEHAYHNLKNNDPNLIANLIKVLAKKAIENEDNINMDLLRRAFKLCGNAFQRYKGHFGLIVARSALQNIKKKFNLMELDDGLDENEIQKQSKVMQPRTTYGMIGVDIMNPQKLAHIQNEAENNK